MEVACSPTTLSFVVDEERNWVVVDVDVWDGMGAKAQERVINDAATNALVDMC